jgi:hypothetical protein
VSFEIVNLDSLPEPLRSAVVARLQQEDAEPLRTTIADCIRERDADPRGSLSRVEHQIFGGFGQSKEIEIEENGEVVVYTDGGKVRIEKNSAYHRKIRLLIESNPAGQLRVKIRKSKTAFKKQPRPRTEAELRGLAKANEARHQEKLRRLERHLEEAKTAS